MGADLMGYPKPPDADEPPVGYSVPLTAILA
jgi:hypothetical protein